MRFYVYLKIFPIDSNTVYCILLFIVIYYKCSCLFGSLQFIEAIIYV
jgi:hypothetical protein